MSESLGIQNDLIEQAKDLLSQLESGNAVEAMQTISNLHRDRDRFLYEEVGKLTRSLHTSIKNFAIDAGLDHQTVSEMSRMADASDRLNYVIQKTEQAANRTMDIVEETLPVSSDLGDKARSLRTAWQRLLRKEMSAEEFRELTREMDRFLEYASGETAKIDTNLSNILLAQDFQDLTGQVIKRVITLVKEVEASLVELVRMAGTIDHLAGFKHDIPTTPVVQDLIGAEGPIINPEQRSDVVSGQDEVDDLLSSLGF
jgi:chemotaxis protein CheZ